jgi:serine/threonine protein kinase
MAEGNGAQVRKKDTGEILAMKILKKDMVVKRKQYEHTMSERRILENIQHPFIVSLRFAFQTEHKLYMVFDFFNGGELYHYLSEGEPFSEDRARFYAYEIALALAYLHKRGIVYRDLKPENLILDSAGHIKITDFGLSKEGVEGESIKSICGTPEYLAPEILKKKPYGAGVDWWSLGTLLFEMIAGLPPFYDKNRQMMYRKILEAPLSPPAKMSAEAADLCAKLLERDPRLRLGYNGGDEVLAHPFFAKYDREKMLRLEIPPPWTPTVSSALDTRNIAAEFTREVPGITPSPAGFKLRDATGATPPSFKDFTFSERGVGAAAHAGGGGPGGDGPSSSYTDPVLVGRRPDADEFDDSVARANEAAAVSALGSLLGKKDKPSAAAAHATAAAAHVGGRGGAAAGAPPVHVGAGQVPLGDLDARSEDGSEED